MPADWCVGSIVEEEDPLLLTLFLSFAKERLRLFFFLFPFTTFRLILNIGSLKNVRLFVA